MPYQFLSYNTSLQSENQAKVAYFTKLMILIFGCPEEMRITNFTRMPQENSSRMRERPFNNKDQRVDGGDGDNAIMLIVSVHLPSFYLSFDDDVQNISNPPHNTFE